MSVEVCLPSLRYKVVIESDCKNTLRFSHPSFWQQEKSALECVFMDVALK